jgi:hypothetical protein
MLSLVYSLNKKCRSNEAQVVEFLPNNCNALSLKPQYHWKKKARRYSKFS